jgi:polyisoprenoid-binding protein YceI
MTSKLLQGIGVAALIALIGGSVAALFAVQKRLHITVAEEEAATARRPDPIAVLSADVAAAHEDVRALNEGFGGQLQTLHDALQGSADERDTRLGGELAQLRRDLATLQARVEQEARNASASNVRASQALATIDANVRELADAIRTDSTRAVEIAPLEVVADTPTPEASVSTSTAAAPEPEVPSALAKNAASAPKKGFLAFQLPTQAFAFDRRQRFAIVPSLSRVGFDAKSTLHDFSGVTTAIEGEFTSNLARPGAGGGGFVKVLSSSLDTGVEGRDESMRAILEPSKFPELRFDWSAFDHASVDAEAHKVAGTARGTLTIHGVAREIAMPVNISVDASKRLAIDGQMKLKLSDFGVKPPSKLGLISVEDEVTVWIALRARALGPVAEEQR